MLNLQRCPDQNCRAIANHYHDLKNYAHICREVLFGIGICSHASSTDQSPCFFPRLGPMLPPEPRLITRADRLRTGDIVDVVQRVVVTGARIVSLPEQVEFAALSPQQFYAAASTPEDRVMAIIHGFHGCERDVIMRLLAQTGWTANVSETKSEEML